MQINRVSPEESNQEDAKSALPSVDPPLMWQAKDWSLIFLVMSFALVTYLVNPAGKSSDEAPWGLISFGMMLTAPLSCALYGAMAPLPFIWRLPLSLAACSFVGLFACIADNDMGFVFAYLLLFTPIWGLLALVRLTLSWKLSLNISTRQANEETLTRQYGLKYLLAWTTVTALLLGLARYIGDNNISRSNDTMWEMLRNIFRFTGTVSIALAPIVALAFVALSRDKPTAWKAVFLIVVLVLLNLLAAVAICWVYSTLSLRDLREAWSQIGQLGVGATVGMLLTLGVLRWAGYRLERGKKHA